MSLAFLNHVSLWKCPCYLTVVLMMLGMYHMLAAEVDLL